MHRFFERRVQAASGMCKVLSHRLDVQTNILNHCLSPDRDGSPMPAARAAGSECEALRRRVGCVPLHKVRSSRNCARLCGGCGSVELGGVALVRQPEAHASGYQLPRLRRSKQWPRQLLQALVRQPEAYASGYQLPRLRRSKQWLRSCLMNDLTKHLTSIT